MLTNVVPENHLRTRRRTLSRFAVTVFAAFAFGCGMNAAPGEDKANSVANGNSNGSAPAANSDRTTETPAEAKAPTVTGACANEYYPIDPSVTKNFEMKGAESDKYSLTQKDITETGFKEDRKFTNGTVVTNNWTCLDEGLKAAEFTNQASFSKGNFEMETVKSDGITIPKTLEAGKEWTSDYDVKVKLNAMKINVNADGKVKIAHKVVSIDEPITVAGNEYNAARIDSEIRVTVTVRGRTMETGKVTASNWYVKDLGMVKQKTDGTFGETTVEYTGNSQ